MTNQEYFLAVAKIDMAYYFIEKLYQELTVRRSPADQMIDSATELDVAENNRRKKLLISWVEEVIEQKKNIGLSYSADGELLMKLKSL